MTAKDSPDTFLSVRPPSSLGSLPDSPPFPVPSVERPSQGLRLGERGSDQEPEDLAPSTERGWGGYPSGEAGRKRPPLGALEAPNTKKSRSRRRRRARRGTQEVPAAPAPLERASEGPRPAPEGQPQSPSPAVRERDLRRAAVEATPIYHLAWKGVSSRSHVPVLALLGHTELLGRAKLFWEPRDSVISREMVLALLGREAAKRPEISLRIRVGASVGTLNFKVLNGHPLQIGRQDWPTLGIEASGGLLWDRGNQTLPLWEAYPEVKDLRI